jgi:regulator of sigma E protease
MFVLVSIISMLIVLGIMVLVHEAGHFFAAKACGVRVEVFSIGFGPRLFGIKRGDTDYRVCLLPLGGFVKMAGEMGGEASSGGRSGF